LFLLANNKKKKKSIIYTNALGVSLDDTFKLRSVMGSTTGCNTFSSGHVSSMHEMGQETTSYFLC
jgi:hypothetical protein